MSCEGRFYPRGLLGDSSPKEHCVGFSVTQTWITVHDDYIDFTKLGRLGDAGWLYRKERGRGIS